MQTSGNQSNKAINSILLDPLLLIIRQLKESNAEDGNYFRINDKELRFYPIYKLASIADSHLPQQESGFIKKEFLHKENPRQSLISQKNEYEQLMKMKFLFGSQIYLKTSKFLSCDIEVIKPFFPNLYVWLLAKERGYVRSKDDKIQYSDTMHTSSIWLCIAAGEQKSGSEEESGLKEVVFCNFDDGSFLYLDQSGIFMVCSEERATRFLLRRVGNSSSFVVSGRNNLSMIVRNKSSQQIKKIIDKSIERCVSRKALDVQLEILPVEDSYITIQLELNYAKRALQYQPSVKLISTIFEELIYYGILDFSRDQTLINDHLQELLLEYDIFEQISKFLIDIFKIDKQSKELEINLRNKKSSFAPKNKRESELVDEPSIFDQTVNQLSQNQEIARVISSIGILCKQNLLVSKVYLSLLKVLIDNQFYQLAHKLLQSNQYFISHFYKLGWFDELYKTVLRSSSKDICRIFNFLCSFCSCQTSLDLTPSSIFYTQTPATNNQYLLYHSVSTTDFHSKIFVYELYNEGAYVFVHDSSSGKDIQFQTFMEQPHNESQMIGMRVQMPSFQQQKQLLLLSQINFIRSVCQNQNYNIVFHYWPIAYALAPYCYRDNFPTLQNSSAKKVILDLLYGIQFIDKETVTRSKYLVSYIETQEDQSKVKFREDVISELKPDLSQFMKNYRKRSQISRKIYKEMGCYFLRKVKKIWEQLKDKTLSIVEVYEGSKGNNLKEWMKVMTIYLSLRLTKVKQKKEGQLLGYIKKIFESVQKEKKGQNEQDQNLMTYFLSFLLELLKYNTKYDRYLQHIKVKKNYEPKFTNQINKVISNFQSKKEVSFSRAKTEITKIQLIDIVYKNLEKGQPREPSEPTSNKLSQEGQENSLTIQMVAARLLELILMNVHEEMIDESVETLTYLVKNSSDLSSLSSFGLLQMMPKFPLETLIKQIALESWYFASNRKLLNTLTNILRLLYNKKSIFRRSINDVYLFDERQLQTVFNGILYPIKFVNQMSLNCQSWLRHNLLEKYPQIYETVDRYLQIIYISLQKIQQRDQNQLVSHILENQDLLSSLRNFLQYFSCFYLEEQQKKNIDTRIFPIQSENPFVELKLNPLSKKIITILDIYMNSNGKVNMRETKIVFQTLGKLISQMAFFNILIFKTFSLRSPLSKRQIVDLMNFFSPSMIASLFNNLPQSWPFFDAYNYIDINYLILHIQKLQSICFKKDETELFPIQQLIFSSSCQGIPQSHNELLTSLKLQIPDYEYMHQIVFLKIILKLVYQNIYIDFVKEFRNKIFWHIIHKHTQTNFQKPQRNQELNEYDIMKRRLLAEIAFEFKQNLSAPNSLSIVEDQDHIIEDANNFIVNFIKYEIKNSKEKLMVALGSESVRFSVEGMKQNERFQYLEFLVCDLTILSKDIGLLADEELLNYFRQCRTVLKNQYKLRVIEKESDPSPAFLAKIDRILFHNEHDEEVLKMRKIPFLELQDERSDDTSKRQKSKPLKKWQKAVDELNSQKISTKHSYLIEDMVQFNSIYVFKSDNQSISLVVNHEDLFFKLLEMSLNMLRLALDLQNQVFILEQIFIEVRQRLKGSKDRNLEIEDYAARLIESIIEEEEAGDQQTWGQRESVWKNNIYALIVKLQIINKSKLLERDTNKMAYSSHLFKLFKGTIFNYDGDCAFIELYKQTLNSKQQKNMFSSLIPFDIVLETILEQVTLEFVEDRLLKQLIKASLVINFGVQNEFRKYKEKDLHSMAQAIEKDKLNALLEQFNQSPFYRHLSNIRN